MFWPGESTESRCLASADLRSPGPEWWPTQSCWWNTVLGSSISAPPPIPIHMLCTRPGWQHAGRDAPVYCELQKARSFAGKWINFPHREWGHERNARGIERTRHLEHAKLRLGDSERMEGGRGKVRVCGEVENTEMSCYPGWWQSHLCCSSVLGPWQTLFKHKVKSESGYAGHVKRDKVDISEVFKLLLGN